MLVTPADESARAELKRADGSIRRTVTVDGHRRDAGTGRICVSGRARDLVTAADGRCLEVAALTLDLEISPEPAYIITSIAASPDVADLASLVGTSARHGLRWRVTELDLGPGDRTLLLRVLQDVPAVASLSRLALLHGPGDDGQSYRPQGPGLGDRVDICAGWAAG